MRKKLDIFRLIFFLTIIHFSHAGCLNYSKLEYVVDSEDNLVPCCFPFFDETENKIFQNCTVLKRHVTATCFSPTTSSQTFCMDYQDNIKKLPKCQNLFEKSRPQFNIIPATYNSTNLCRFPFFYNWKCWNDCVTMANDNLFCFNDISNNDQTKVRCQYSLESELEISAGFYPTESNDVILKINNQILTTDYFINNLTRSNEPVEIRFFENHSNKNQKEYFVSVKAVKSNIQGHIIGVENLTNHSRPIISNSVYQNLPAFVVKFDPSTEAVTINNWSVLNNSIVISNVTDFSLKAYNASTPDETTSTLSTRLTDNKNASTPDETTATLSTRLTDNKNASIPDETTPTLSTRLTDNKKPIWIFVSVLIAALVAASLIYMVVYYIFYREHRAIITN